VYEAVQTHYWQSKIYNTKFTVYIYIIVTTDNGVPGSNPGHYKRKKKVVGLERGSLSLVSTTEEVLDRKVVAPV
jgi:hypothetical protein